MKFPRKCPLCSQQLKSRSFIGVFGYHYINRNCGNCKKFNYSFANNELMFLYYKYDKMNVTITAINENTSVSTGPPPMSCFLVYLLEINNAIFPKSLDAEGLENFLDKLLNLMVYS